MDVSSGRCSVQCRRVPGRLSHARRPSKFDAKHLLVSPSKAFMRLGCLGSGVQVFRVGDFWLLYRQYRGLHGLIHVIFFVRLFMQHLGLDRMQL